jgi:hypothetical protein
MYVIHVDGKTRIKVWWNTKKVKRWKINASGEKYLTLVEEDTTPLLCSYGPVSQNVPVTPENEQEKHALRIGGYRIHDP